MEILPNHDRKVEQATKALSKAVAGAILLATGEAALDLFNSTTPGQTSDLQSSNHQYSSEDAAGDTLAALAGGLILIVVGYSIREIIKGKKGRMD